MKELKTVPTDNSVEEYLEGISNEDRRADCLKIFELMKKISKEKPIMWGESMVGFGEQVLKYSTGREIKWLTIGFSSRKNAISLYLTCNLDPYESILKKLGKHKRGKGCLYIKKLEDIDLAILEKLFIVAIQAVEEKNP